MGSTKSRELQENAEALNSLLKRHSGEIKEEKLVNLLQWIQATLPRTPVAGALNITTWQNIGRTLRHEALLGDMEAFRNLPAWSRVMDTLIAAHKKASSAARLNSRHPSHPPNPGPETILIQVESDTETGGGEGLSGRREERNWDSERFVDKRVRFHSSHGREGNNRGYNSEQASRGRAGPGDSELGWVRDSNRGAAAGVQARYSGRGTDTGERPAGLRREGRGECVQTGMYPLPVAGSQPHGEHMAARAAPSCSPREQEMSLPLPPAQPCYPDHAAGGYPSLPVARPSSTGHAAGGCPPLPVERQICTVPVAEADSDGTEYSDTGEDPGEGLYAMALTEDRSMNAESHARNWNRCREEAVKSGDWEILRACPVVYRPRQNPQFQSLPYEVTKDLRRIVKESGVSSSHMFSYLETMGSTYVFTPHDWKTLLKMALSITQYSVWLSDFRESCIAYANEPGALQAGMTTDHLVGEGAYSAPGAQIGYPREIYEVISKMVLRSVRKLPSTDKDSNLSFAKVLQEATETFPKFLDRLQTALNKQVDDDTARELLFKQLTYENANNDCRRALQSLPKRESCTIAEMVRACQNVGSVDHHSTSIATALAAQLTLNKGEKEKGCCYRCGSTNHRIKNCPKKPPFTAYHKCCKGKQWACTCRSRADHGNSPAFSGNYRRGARSRAPCNQINSAPNNMPAICSQPPQEALAWTWPPESQ
ncbi:endogenous retrovirus group K member 5 Gag polyprotein-like [Myiozetetes cayanensis]|uniref:endogenous retrovirus group K member 5 Gag polyprotein-like n=1 Tax=Myiozetetes cayanensis TaxID=478635 RepID=UPI00215E2E72|nr:endogenous retrovirus group K member 5 Gag polyprotein-like [Myiozetetes cayanensis]